MNQNEFANLFSLFTKTAQEIHADVRFGVDLLMQIWTVSLRTHALQIKPTRWHL